MNIPSPTNIQITNTGPRKIELTWDEVEDPNNLSNGQVLNYRVIYYPTNFPSDVVTYDTPNYIPKATLTGLLPNTQYTLTVSAVSVFGEGVVSDPSQAAMGTTTGALPQNIWDLPAAIFADPSTLGLTDLVIYLATGVKNIFLKFEEDALSPIVNYVNAIKQAGGNVILSFDSNSMPELSTDNIEQIIAFYENQLSSATNETPINYLNFDLDGVSFLNPSDIQEHITAVTSLLQNHSNLRISYTLNASAVNYEGTIYAGLDFGQDFLKQLEDSGIIPSLINIKPSSISSEFTLSPDLLITLKAAIDGSGTNGEYDQGVVAQLQAIYPNMSANDIYHMLGIDPTYGINPDGAVFTLLNMVGLAAYSILHNIGNLNGTDITRDLNLIPDIGLPLAFTNILTTYTGGIPIADDLSKTCYGTTEAYISELTA